MDGWKLKFSWVTILSGGRLFRFSYYFLHNALPVVVLHIASAYLEETDSEKRGQRSVVRRRVEERMECRGTGRR